MPKKIRKTITILFLIVLIFIIFYTFNIFNINNTLHGISVSKVVNGNTTITTTIGSSLNLPNEFAEHNISIADNDKIISIVSTQTKNANLSTNSTEITLTTEKSINEIFDYYKDIFSNPMTTRLDTSAIIIGGDAENLVKITIETGKYKISMEKR